MNKYEKQSANMEAFKLIIKNRINDLATDINNKAFDHAALNIGHDLTEDQIFQMAGEKLNKWIAKYLFEQL